MSIRSIFFICVIGTLISGGALTGFAKEAPSSNEAARERGLAYLAAQQQEDGSYAGTYPIAYTSLAVVAWLRNGTGWESGEHRAQFRRAVSYLLEHQSVTGYFSNPLLKAPAAAPGEPRPPFERVQGPRDNMYSHALATWAIAEVYGQRSDDRELRRSLELAVMLIVKSQSDRGGWRYLPEAADADTSNTAFQVLALAKAKQHGIEVPEETLTRAAEYIESCQVPGGGFAYVQRGSSGGAFPRSLACTLALVELGRNEGEAVKQATDYLNKLRDTPDPTDVGHAFYQLLFLRLVCDSGTLDDKVLEWSQKSWLGKQAEDGSWTSPIGNAYATAIACIALAPEPNPAGQTDLRGR